MLETLAARFALTEGMKGFLSKFGVPLVILIAILLAIVVIDHRGFERAEKEAHDRELERAAIVAAVVGQIDQQLDRRLAATAATLRGTLDTIDKEKTIVQPIITREIARDPRLADPNSCLSPGLLAAVNRARGHSAGAELGEAGSADAASVPGSGSRR
jgi:hypothetical protein